MSIKRLKVKNFKSFKELDITLNQFNLVVGANASGKSNFIHIFEFLRDIVNYNLKDAIAMQGEIEYLRNIKIATSDNLTIEITADCPPISTIFQVKKKIIGVKPCEIKYKFSLNTTGKKSNIIIEEDKLNIKLEFESFESKNGKIKITNKLGKGYLNIVNNHNEGKITSRFYKPKNISINKSNLFPPYFLKSGVFRHLLLIETPLSHIPLNIVENFQNISIYDIDPKSCKKATSIKGKTKLEEDGCNLAIVLKNIIEDNEKKRKLTNLIKDILDFVKSINIEKFTDKSLLVTFQEKYSKNKFIPASLISDGTMNITALIVALYFETHIFTIFEEPDRNIHPYLISKIINMMKDAKENKRIVITSHNPEMIKHVDLNDILLVSRDKEGFSEIYRPFEKDEIRVFLENDMGVDEIYIKNLLEL